MPKRKANRAVVVVKQSLESVLREMVERCHSDWQRLTHPPIGIHKSLAATFGFEPAVGVGGATSSLEIGKRVHSEIERYTNARAILTTSTATTSTAATTTTSSSPQALSEMHTYTRQVLALLERHDWQPIASEVPLHDPQSDIGTRIDLLAIDCKRQTIVLIELKTGYADDYRTPIRRRRPMPVLLGNASDTLETRAHLQLAWMDWLVRERYGLLRLRSVIIRVNETYGACEPELLQCWARKRQAQIVAALRAIP
jgi:hypothetical protein